MNVYLEEDRLGSRIHLEIHLYAYCLLNNIKFIGTVFKKNKIKNLKLLKEHIELNNFLKIPCPKNYNNIDTKNIYNLNKIKNLYEIINYNNKLYPEKNINNLLTNNFIKILKDNFIYKKNKIFTIVVHIRRGDVNPKKYPQRYLYNKYYIDLLELIISIINIKKYEIIILSETQSYESFECFKKFKNIKLKLDTNTIENWKNIINSNIFIMSKSSYSYTPALFCKGIVIYHSFWCSKIDEWILFNSNIKNILKKKLLDLGI